MKGIASSTAFRYLRSLHPGVASAGIRPDSSRFVGLTGGKGKKLGSHPFEISQRLVETVFGDRGRVGYIALPPMCHLPKCLHSPPFAENGLASEFWDRAIEPCPVVCCDRGCSSRKLSSTLGVLPGGDRSAEGEQMGELTKLLETDAFFGQPVTLGVWASALPKQESHPIPCRR